MAQTTILAANTTPATSSDVVVAAGGVATIGLFASGTIPSGVQVSVRIDSPGDDQPAAVLNLWNPVTVLAGPGTFRAVRPDISSYGVSVGVYTES